MSTSFETVQCVQMCEFFFKKFQKVPTLFMNGHKPRVNLPKLRQSTTRIVKGGQYISCSGSSMSKNLTKVEKFGFFLAFIITEKTKIKLIKSI